MAVIVPRVLGQDLAQVPPADDQQGNQALAAERAHGPFRVGIRTRRPDRRLDNPRAIPGEYLIECIGELAVPVADQELEHAAAVAEAHQEVAGLPGGPMPSRMSGDAKD